MEKIRRETFFSKAFRSRNFTVGFLIIIAVVILSVFAPVFTSFDPLGMGSGPRLSAPTVEHIMGTDEYGRDLFSRILYGGRSSILIGFISVSIAALIGINIGLVAGYCGKYLDSISMRVMDAILAFPATLLAIVVIAIMSTGMMSATLAISIVNIPSFARLARANIIKEKNREYILSCKALGYSDVRIIYCEILPNIVSTLFVQITVSIAAAILLESALSFIGLGNPPPTPSWGSMLEMGKEYLLDNFWYAFFPGLAITILVIGLYALGDGLREILNPEQ